MIICVSSSHGASSGTSFHQTDPLPSINPFPCIVSPTSFVKSIHHIKPELQALAFVGAMIVPSTCIIVNISGVGYGGDLAFGGDPLEQGAFLGGDATTTGAGLDAGGGDGGALRVWSTKSIIFILLNCMLCTKEWEMPKKSPT